MEKMFVNFLKSFKKTIRNNYNLSDFAKSSKNQTLPRSRASLNEEYGILNQYKQKIMSKGEALIKLSLLKGLTETEAKDILENIKNNNITPMKFK